MLSPTVKIIYIVCIPKKGCVMLFILISEVCAFLASSKKITCLDRDNTIDFLLTFSTVISNVTNTCEGYKIFIGTLN